MPWEWLKESEYQDEIVGSKCTDCGKKLHYKKKLCTGCKFKRLKNNLKWEIKKITFLIILGILIWAYLENKLPQTEDLLKELPMDTVSEIIDKYTYKIDVRPLGPKTVWMNYTLRGERNVFEFLAYRTINDYLGNISQKYWGKPSQKELELRFLDEKNQKKDLKRLIEIIRKITRVKDDQARIAISMVQMIDYDNDSFRKRTFLNERYPYEVLYDAKGLCGEKSKLLVLLLRELGYSTILFHWDAQHQAAGVKCPMEQSYLDSGYCFIETVRPTIPTEKPRGYGPGQKMRLSDDPRIITISDGNQLDLSIEYSDAQEFKRIEDLGTTLPKEEYNKYLRLATKYGITFDG